MPGPIILVDNDVELIRDIDVFLKDKGFSVIIEPNPINLSTYPSKRMIYRRYKNEVWDDSVAGLSVF